VRESARVVPGVTLVCELHGAEMDALRGEAPLLQSLADRCGRRAERAMPMLLAQGMAHASPWEVPLVRARAEGLTGSGAGAALSRRRGRAAAGVGRVAAARAGGGARGGEAVTLLQALERCREEGGIVEEDPRQAWPGWASREPGPGPWVLTVEGRGLVARVIGKDVLWDMPTLPEMHARPGRGARGRCWRRRRWRGCPRKPDDESRRAALLAHLLGARAAADGDEVLAELPLVRALRSAGADSLSERSAWQQALAEEPRPGLLPMGAVTRELAGAALLVTPGEACMLRLRRAVVAAGRPLAGGVDCERRGADARAAAAAGGTGERAAGGAGGVGGGGGGAAGGGDGGDEGGAVERGLHLDDVQLPAPLECVGGRLVLTRQGARVSGDRLGGEIRGMCRTVVMQALEQRRLHRPGGTQHAALGEFIARCEAAAAAGTAPLIADLLAPKTGADEVRLGVRLGVSLQRHPLERCRRRGRGGFESSCGRRWRGRWALARRSCRGRWRRWRGSPIRGWEVELGKRNGFVQRALAEQPGAEDPYGGGGAGGGGVVLGGAGGARARERGWSTSGWRTIACSRWCTRTRRESCGRVDCAAHDEHASRLAGGGAVHVGAGGRVLRVLRAHGGAAGARGVGGGAAAAGGGGERGGAGGRAVGERDGSAGARGDAGGAAAPDFWDPGLPLGGLLRGDKFAGLRTGCSTRAGSSTVEQCPTPFATVVYELAGRRTRVLERGGWRRRSRRRARCR
jgi:hypothetical protein